MKTLLLASLVSFSVLAQTAPAPALGDGGVPPTSGAATTATKAGLGVRKEPPGPPVRPGPEPKTNESPTSPSPAPKGM